MRAVSSQCYGTPLELDSFCTASTSSSVCSDIANSPTHSVLVNSPAKSAATISINSSPGRFTDLYISEERRKYYSHREKSRANPEKYLTIIIDGMDQSKTNIPSLTCAPKSLQNMQGIRTHLTGALVHTRSPHGKRIYAYYDLLQYPHDSNLVIQVSQINLSAQRALLILLHL